MFSNSNGNLIAIYKVYSPLLLRVLVLFFLIFSFKLFYIDLFLSKIIAVSIVLLAVSCLLVSQNLYFDCKNCLIITVWQLFFLKKIKEVKLPEIDYIAIIRVKTNQNLNYKSITYKDRGYKCRINIVFKYSKERYKELCVLDEEKAIKLATKLSITINKPLLDNSKPQKQWINK